MKRVLIHQSHYDPARPDGWSGAPGEATFIRQEIVAELVILLAQRGIEVTIIPGDFLSPPNDTDAKYIARHPEISQDYDLFLAPHYEANVHPTGGWFAGRAAASTTAAEDDRFLGILRHLYRQIPGVPAEHNEWSNPNVTDYYAFRCTSATTPGALIELGVGAPGAPDHDWLWTNRLAIAGILALAVSEFLGLEEDEMTKEERHAEFIEFVKEDITPTIVAMKEAYDPLVEEARKTGMLDAEQEGRIATAEGFIQKLRAL